jgi:hypothetical protein
MQKFAVVCSMMAENESLPTNGTPPGEEEFDIDLQQEGVEDESKTEAEDIERFNISSYGADYTVDSLVKRLQTGAFYIPPFQRSYIWTQNQASRFIESLLLGLPVPGIFLYKEPGTNKHLVIDGQQRLRTLQFFFEGTFFEKRFRLTNISKRWEGKTYKELDEADHLKIDDAIIHATIFQQDEPKSGDSSIYFVFERINTGGIRLSSQEIRVCLNYGPFAQLLRELNEYDKWREIYGPVSKRLKDQELILRFFAFFFDDVKYERPMNIFLNDFMKFHRELRNRKEREFRDIFTRTIDIINSSIGNEAFRPSGTLNAAVFDSVMVAVARRLQASALQRPEELGEQYKSLLRDHEYEEAYKRSTADEERVKRRLDLAKKYISTVR